MDSIVSQKSKSALTPGRKVSSEGDLNKQISHDSPRRSYGPAAMIGVALSVGACGLLVPQKGDAVLAAEKADIESLAYEPNAIPATDPLPPGVTSASLTTPDASKPTVLASRQVHTVQEGESLSNIARVYGITAQQVAHLNQFPVTSVLRVGQTISLPIATAPADDVPVLAMTPPSLPAPVASKVRQDTAIVKLKEKQSRLKKSLAELRSEENPIIESLPTSPQQVMPLLSSEAVSFSKHRVEVGETLTTIARSNGISPNELAVLNRISDPNTLFANQVLKVPQLKTMQAIPQTDLSQSKPSPVLFSGAKSSSSTIAFSAPANRVSIPELPQSSWIPNVSTTSTPKTDRAASDRASNVSVEPSMSNRTRIDKLMVEVKNLRQKYQTTQVAYATQQNYVVPTTSTASVTVPTVSMPTRSGSLKIERRTVNPEFQKRVETVPNVSIQSVTQNRLDRVIQAPTLPQQTLPVVSATAPRLIARASVGGSSNYASPLVQTTALRMAAPQMPSIGTSDSYLPQGKGSMKGYIWPAQGVFTSGYGWRWGRMHKGIDVAGPVGTPIVASAPGVVSYAGYNDGGYGYLVEIDHADGSMTRYAHNNRILVRNGQQVAQGQQVSEMGSTGFSTGPHLHFEIHTPQGAMNPMAYLPNDRS